MKIAAAILFVVMFPITTFAQEPQATPALPSVTLPPELDRVLRDYEAAWRARDPKGLAEIFAEDGFVLASGKDPVRGREAIREAYSGAGGPLYLRAMAYATSGDVGYIIGGYRGMERGPDEGKFVLALKRNGERWLVMSDIDNSNQRRPGAPSPQPSN